MVQRDGRTTSYGVPFLHFTNSTASSTYFGFYGTNMIYTMLAESGTTNSVGTVNLGYLDNRKNWTAAFYGKPGSYTSFGDMSANSVVIHLRGDSGEGPQPVRRYRHALRDPCLQPTCRVCR